MKDKKIDHPKFKVLIVESDDIKKAGNVAREVFKSVISEKDELTNALKGISDYWDKREPFELLMNKNTNIEDANLAVVVQAVDAYLHDTQLYYFDGSAYIEVESPTFKDMLNCIKKRKSPIKRT